MNSFRFWERGYCYFIDHPKETAASTLGNREKTGRPQFPDGPGIFVFLDFGF
jgi:hypothetical protein